MLAAASQLPFSRSWDEASLHEGFRSVGRSYVLRDPESNPAREDDDNNYNNNKKNNNNNNNNNNLPSLYPVSEVMQPKDGMNGGMHELKFFMFPYGDS